MTVCEESFPPNIQAPTPPMYIFRPVFHILRGYRTTRKIGGGGGGGGDYTRILLKSKVNSNSA